MGHNECLRRSGKSISEPVTSFEETAIVIAYATCRFPSHSSATSVVFASVTGEHTGDRLSVG